MATIDSEWHNTGGNGTAHEVWVRKVGRFGAIINVLPHRCVVDTWIGGSIADEMVPFGTLAGAKRFADEWLSASVARANVAGNA